MTLEEIDLLLTTCKHAMIRDEDGLYAACLELRERVSAMECLLDRETRRGDAADGIRMSAGDYVPRAKLEAIAETVYRQGRVDGASGRSFDAGRTRVLGELEQDLRKEEKLRMFGKRYGRSGAPAILGTKP